MSSNALPPVASFLRAPFIHLSMHRHNTVMDSRIIKKQSDLAATPQQSSPGLMVLNPFEFGQCVHRKFFSKCPLCFWNMNEGSQIHSGWGTEGEIRRT